MAYVDNNSWKQSSYNNMNGVFLFLPLILYFEIETILNDARIYTFSFWFWNTFCGVVGFMMGIVTIMQIKLTSPLTHNVVGTAKGT
jgi:GDP-fucose transporter C1